MVGLQMKELAPGHSRKVLLGLGMGTTGPRSLVAKAWKEMGKYISYCISTTELHMLQVLHICMCMYIFHHCMVPCGPQFTGMVIVGTEVSIIFCHSQTICGPKGNSFRVLAHTSLKRGSSEDMKPLFWSKIKTKFKLKWFKKTKKNLFSSIPEKYKMTVRGGFVGWILFRNAESLTWNLSGKPTSVHSSMVFTSPGWRLWLWSNKSELFLKMLPRLTLEAAHLFPRSLSDLVY